MCDIISEKLETLYRPLADLGLDRWNSAGDGGGFDQTTGIGGGPDLYDGE